MDLPKHGMTLIGRIPKGTRLLEHDGRWFLAHPDHPLREVVVDPLTGDGRLVEVPAALQRTEELPRPAGH